MASTTQNNNARKIVVMIILFSVFTASLANNLTSPIQYVSLKLVVIDHTSISIVSCKGNKGGIRRGQVIEPFGSISQMMAPKPCIIHTYRRQSALACPAPDKGTGVCITAQGIINPGVVPTPLATGSDAIINKYPGDLHKAGAVR